MVAVLTMSLLAGCSGRQKSESPTTQPDVAEDLYGTAVDSRTVPEFEATNRDGSSRGPDNLTDGPSVVWFYPAPDTPG
jgi:hypothetical protein